MLWIVDRLVDRNMQIPEREMNGDINNTIEGVQNQIALMRITCGFLVSALQTTIDFRAIEPFVRLSLCAVLTLLFNTINLNSLPDFTASSTIWTTLNHLIYFN